MDDRLLQQVRRDRSPKRDELSPEDVLELNALYAKIKEINLDKAVAERIASLTPVERLVEDLKEGKPVERRLRKPHHNTVRAKKRKVKAKYYREVYKPRRNMNLAKMLTTPEGWWKYLTEGSWKKRGVEVELTYEEFVEHIYPVSVGKGLIPVFLRYDSEKPISLENVIVKDTKSRSVVFDGAEHKLRLLGMIL
jgi:hypothetical protein